MSAAPFLFLFVLALSLIIGGGAMGGGGKDVPHDSSCFPGDVTMTSIAPSGRLRHPTPKTAILLLFEQPKTSPNLQPNQTNAPKKLFKNQTVLILALKKYTLNKWDTYIADSSNLPICISVFLKGRLFKGRFEKYNRPFTLTAFPWNGSVFRLYHNFPSDLSSLLLSPSKGCTVPHIGR